MKKFLGLILVVAVFCSCSEGKSSGKEEVSLNGTWRFLASNDVDEAKVLAQDFKKWDTLTVPGNWDTRERYSTYVGKGYYQKDFKFPENWDKKQIRVKFGAVYQTSKVWLNGEYLGKHTGGYLPFEFNITNKLKKNAINSLVVMADNSIKRGAWWAWGGISREVKLVANESVRAIYQHISAIPDFEKEEVNFRIKYKLENNGDTQQEVRVISKIDEGNVANETVAIDAHSINEYSVSFVKPLSDYKLWHFDSPNLYHLTTELNVAGTIVEEVKNHFGVRKFEARGEQFFLNNKPVRMNGMNRVHDHPKYGNTEPDHLVIADFKDLKALGCNFSRSMHAPLAENILDFCDKNGMLLVEEIPVWGAVDPNSRPNNPQTREWMKDLVERDFNHPSVVAWSVGNELRTDKPKWGKQHLTKEQYGYVNQMLDYVEKLDATRLKTYVSNTSYQAGEIGKEPYEKVDFLCVNSYGHALKIVEKVHARFPNKPIFISEIGRGQIGPAPNAVLQEDLLGWLKELKSYPYVTGLALWCYNDYRSNYKGTPASGFREWGIVSETREQKKAYEQLKKIYKEWQTDYDIKL